jgi:hypothetical protein
MFVQSGKKGLTVGVGVGVGVGDIVGVGVGVVEQSITKKVIQLFESITLTRICGAPKNSVGMFIIVDGSGGIVFDIVAAETQYIWLTSQTYTSNGEVPVRLFISNVFIIHLMLLDNFASQLL